MILSGLKPERVFNYFEKLCDIPHGSGNCKKISEYCLSVAKDLGLECCTDEHFNVIIKKDATLGYENKPTVILQGHLDMVCEKDEKSSIDFLKDGLELKVTDDYVSANGTTLGGDDGIGVAMALAILEDKSLKHPPIEVLFTTDEETGMYGAVGLDASILEGKMLINIDSENEGAFTVGCAGGARAELFLPIEKEKISGKCYKITVSGLKGGHSGVEIDKGRLNANIVMANFLNTIGVDFNIIEINGGLKDNAIPLLSECLICCDEDLSDKAREFSLKNRVDTDSGLLVTVEKTNNVAEGFSTKFSKKVVDFLLTVPNGIQVMSKDIEGLVETSLNLGILKTEDNFVKLSFAVRSSKNNSKSKLLNKLEKVAIEFGGVFSQHGHYPAWEYRKNSPLRDKMVEVYKNIYGKTPVVETIHAGLECGILSDKIKDLDAVSIGPDMCDIHTSREKLSISSTKRVYEFLCELLKNM